MKRNVSISIDPKILEKAHALGLNVSKITENTLKLAIEALENLKKPEQAFSVEPFPRKGSLAGGEGFEPSTPNLGAFPNQNINWASFREYLVRKNYRGYYSSQLFNDALQFHDCLLRRDLSRIKQLSREKSANVLKSLSSLSKFLGQYPEYLELVRATGLTWLGRSADDLIIDRLNKTQDPEELWSWVRTVKEVWPQHADFLDFMSVTGLRYSEAVNSYNLVVKLSREQQLSKKYFNVRTGFLEHFRYKDLFIRQCKKAFISYVPLEMLDSIGRKELIPRPYAVRKVLARRHVPQRFSDLRELNASFLTKYLKEVEIDLLHGRVTGSVLKEHYLNVNLLTDFKERVLKAQKEILEKIAAAPVIVEKGPLLGEDLSTDKTIFPGL